MIGIILGARIVSSRNRVRPVMMRLRSSEVIGGTPWAKIRPKMRALCGADKGLWREDRRPETPFERGTQRQARLRQRYDLPEVLQAGHPTVGNPARNDAVEMAEIGRHVERDAVRRHPFADPHADRRDLALAARSAGLPDPDA